MPYGPSRPYYLTLGDSRWRIAFEPERDGWHASVMRHDPARGLKRATLYAVAPTQAEAMGALLDALQECVDLTNTLYRFDTQTRAGQPCPACGYDDLLFTHGIDGRNYMKCRRCEREWSKERPETTPGPR